MLVLILSCRDMRHSCPCPLFQVPFQIIPPPFSVSDSLTRYKCISKGSHAQKQPAQVLAFGLEKWRCQHVLLGAALVAPGERAGSGRRGTVVWSGSFVFLMESRNTPCLPAAQGSLSSRSAGCPS